MSPDIASARADVTAAVTSASARRYPGNRRPGSEVQELTRLKDPHVDGRRHGPGMLEEGVRRPGEVGPPAEVQADRRDRAPVDGHRQPRADQPQRLRRPERVEMPRAEPWAPAGDRKKRQVDATELGHFREEVGVAGEVDPVPRLDQVAQAWRLRTERRP